MRVHAVRLTPGTDLREELEQIAERHALRAGFILTCVGSLSAARLRMPGAAGGPAIFRDFAEPMEIVSLVGTLGPDGLHIHISLARRDGACVGGHLVRGCIVGTTAELVIGEAPGLAFHRRLDAATGYAELNVEPAAEGGYRRPMLNPSDDDAPYHAHIYYSADQRTTAAALRDDFARLTSEQAKPRVLFVGAMKDGKAGPHPISQYEIHFLSGALGDVLPMIEASGLKALVHPLTDDDLADHTTLAHWIGAPLELDLTTLDPPGVNQGVPRFGKTDF